MTGRPIKHPIRPLLAPDDFRFDQVADLAQYCSSHCQSLILAAERQDKHLMVLHCRQIKTLMLEVFRTVRAIADEELG